MATQGDLFGFPQQAPPPKAPATPVEPPAPGPKTVTLIDASGIIFRAYHALPPLTTSKGVPTHAVLGFTRMMLKMLRERKPTHLALCFDRDSRKGRLAIDPNYKANRSETPSDLLSQFELIRKIAQVLEFPIVEMPGWEADDVIATLTDRAREKGFEVEIITSDKDFLQLLKPGVRIFDPMKDKPITEADALERYGVKASQMRDYQALVGDAIDNIPKVPGIGPKTAADLLTQFGTVEVLMGRLDEVKKPKIQEALKANLDQLKRALQLVSFRHELPLDVDLDGLARKELHAAEARALFTELEFYRLSAEMPSAPATPLRQAATLIRDEAGLLALCATLQTAARVSLAPAFEGEPHSARLEGLGCVIGTETCVYLVVPAIGRAALEKHLGPALKRPGLQLEAHDGKALLHLLASVGIEGVTLHTDVELISYLLNPSRKEHALPDLARERLRTELPAWPDGQSGRGKATLAEIPEERAAMLFAASADAVDRLVGDLWIETEGMGLSKLATELELPLVPVLTKMERTGVLIDRAALAEISVGVNASVEAMLKDVYKHAGREFNVGSPVQLAQVLFDDLKLPVHKKRSTDHEVLEKLAEEHPLPRAIIEYRTVAKLKSTYLDTLPTLIGPDGRIRTTFHQASAATGRLSSTNPNLQNIPIRTELGKQIRRAFVAEPGWVLVSADYSQVELRILAHISDDEGLVKAFAENADVHARTAAEVFSVPLAEVTREQRSVAKMVNYGIAYGLSAHGLSARLNIPIEESKSIIERYFARFPGINGYVEGTLEKARRTGYVESIFGRRRYMPDLVSRNRQVSMAAERAAINMPIQGSAADLVKRAMLVMEKQLVTGGLRGRMLLQVHDELLFESPEGEAAKLAALAKQVMEGVATLKVPLVVDVGQGRSWAEAH
ncbi:MAG: DNA polymerase I [Archangium sp.]|nr:DNA polymerase I [Archangium sp.]